MHRHVADDPAVATILTTDHDIHRITVALSAGRISTAHATAAAARANLALLRQNALMTAAHSNSAPRCAGPGHASPPARVTRRRSVDPDHPSGHRPRPWGAAGLLDEMSGLYAGAARPGRCYRRRCGAARARNGRGRTKAATLLWPDRLPIRRVHGLANFGGAGFSIRVPTTHRLEGGHRDCGVRSSVTRRPPAMVNVPRPSYSSASTAVRSSVRCSARIGVDPDAGNPSVQRGMARPAA